MWSTDGYDLHLVANIVGNRTFDLKTIYSVPAGTTFVLHQVRLIMALVPSFARRLARAREHASRLLRF
jgi:hypothetical protein